MGRLVPNKGSPLKRQNSLPFGIQGKTNRKMRPVLLSTLFDTIVTEIQREGVSGAPHSSVLAWRIPGTGEPGGLPSMGSHRAGHD